MGYEVTGSDLKRSEITDRLVELGATFNEGHDPKHVAGAGIVVYTAAASEDNCELVAAREQGIPTIPRPRLLADLMRLKPDAIAVGGTHGKTTTASMISAMFENADVESTSIVGGIINRKGSTVAWGNGNLLVAETDEHDGSFLRLNPTVSVVTSIDAEHLEYYGTLDAIKRSFVDFINKIPFYGFSVVCIDDPNVRDILPQIDSTCLTYAIDREADVTAKNVRLEVPNDGQNKLERIADVRTVFDVHCSCAALCADDNVGAISIHAIGDHNVRNALAAVTVGLALGLDFEQIREGLHSYRGVRRRLQLKAVRDSIAVVEDYAHHPTEIESTLRAVRLLEPARIIAVFQPHLYSRTKFFCADFGRSLLFADKVVVTEIYGAREEPMPGVSAMDIVAAAQDAGHKDAVYIADQNEVKGLLGPGLCSGDVVIFLGAGDIYKASDQMAELLSQRGT